MGACSLIFENVPACREGVRRVSTWWTSGVFVVRELPVIMKALEVGVGRLVRRCFSTLPDP